MLRSGGSGDRRSRLALAAASGLAALGLGELLARALAPSGPPIRFTQNVDMLERIGRQQAGSVIEQDPELFWRLIPGTAFPEKSFPMRGVIANRQGFREDHEVPREKPEGEIRLLFLGDSCTFGSGLLHDQGYVQRVEDLLRARFPGAAVEAINAGVPGYSLFQGWRLLETRGLGYEPDLVAVQFGWNGATGWDGMSDLEHHEARRAARPPAALRWSALCRLAWSAARSRPPEREEGRPRLSDEETFSLLKRVHAATSARGIDLLVIVWPVPYNVDPQRDPSLRTRWQRLSYLFGGRLRFDPDGAQLVDLVPVARGLAGRVDPGDIFLDHIHGTETANRAFAQAIVEAVGPRLEGRLRRGN